MKTGACDQSRLDAFLNGTLTEQAESELTQHLGQCSDCARELEKRAAEPSRWNDAKDHLSECVSTEIQRSGQVKHGDSLPLSVRQVLGMLDPTDDPGYLGRIGGYEVIGVVGSGAMGVVLKAADRPLDRVVALKVMNPSLASCGTARQRFAREAKAAAGVLHPNVIAIHGVSIDHALPYLVMPYVKGSSLRQRIDKQGPLSLTEILRIGSQVAAGLAAAHQKGLIHRDIKPSNIMLDVGVETAVITDFGLARTIDDATMTRSGAITGTPEFMSPEQARGDSIDCSSDVFSLGSVLYSLSTGQRPFRAQTSFGVLRRITDEEPTPIRDVSPDIPKWFCQIVNKMHAKSPDDRPAAGEVRDLLEGCLAHVYQPDRIPLPDRLSATARTQPTFFTKPFIFRAITIMTISTLALLIAAMIPSSSSEPENSIPPRSANQQAAESKATVFETLNLTFPDSDRRGKLVIDINRGFVEVIGHDKSEVIIEILNPPSSARKQGESELQAKFAPNYDLDTDKANNVIKLDTYNQDYVLNMRVRVPRETDLDLDTYYDGYLQVKNVSGHIKTRSQNCDIRLLDISGSATAFGYNGIFTIRFKEVASDARLDFESYNGDVNLTLPTPISATTAISTGKGTYFSAFDIESISKNERPVADFPKIGDNVSEYQFGTINGGGIPIRIESKKGKIVVRKAEQ